MGLGLFSFAKHLMWKDLVENRETLAQTPLVRHLLLEGRDSALPRLELPAPAAFDRPETRKDLFCPLPADSSQHAAVAAALSGQSFVMVGPPGTGKSQTIANMIAQCLAHGKTVLFVSEKSAALQVVYARLRALGLAEMCLELHSSKARKIDVLKQLGRSAAAQGALPVAERARAVRRFCSAAEELNAYADAVNKRHKDGLTVGEAVAAHIDGALVPECAAPDALDGAAMATTREELAQLDRRADGISALHAAGMRFVRRSGWSASLQRELAERSLAMAALADEMHKGVAELAALLRLPEESVSSSAREFDALCIRLPEAFNAGVFSFIAHKDFLQIAPLLEESLPLVAECAAVREKLVGDYELSAHWIWPDIINVIKQLDAGWWTDKSVWFWTRRKRREAAYRELFPCRVWGGASPDLENDLPLLRELHWYHLRMTERGYEFLRSRVACWEHIATDLARCRKLTAFARDVFRIMDVSGIPYEEIRTVLLRFARNKGAALEPDKPFGQFVAKRRESLERFAEAHEEFVALLGGVDTLETANYAQYAAFCREIAAGAPRLREWCAWRAARETCGDVAAAYADVLEKGVVAPGEAERAFCVNYARRKLGVVVEESPLLARFNEKAHAGAMEQLRTQAAVLRGHGAAYAKARGAASQDSGIVCQDEWRLLRRELMKKSRHLPIRQLLRGMPNLVRDLTPCMFMSPLSIAQHLAPENARFDVAIFDEASQIPVWDALGALARADSAVIAGDPKQLPPTSFFQRGEEEWTDDAFAAADQESILKQCIASGMPEIPLSWHYRSRHESLIAFSNKRYYDNSLVTFPAPAAGACAIWLHRVDGVYARGTSRTNAREAKALAAHVVAALRRCLEENKPASIGVATFNAQQQQLVENLLDQERRENPRFDVFFGADAAEPVIVKNIENIQGDERDVMYFSLCYGPDKEGRMSMNFGALNTEGGERRLNVAVTRARREMHVFASFDPDAIDVGRTNAQGVRDLRAFMEYARARDAAPQRGATGEKAGKDIVVAVAGALRSKGWNVRCNVGDSAGRVDIAVVDPKNPEAYLAGVLCDGASYAFFTAAQDRDAVRPAVLRGLGWSILHAWSMEWHFSPENALERLDAELRALTRWETPPAPPARQAKQAPAPKKAPETPEAMLNVFDDGRIARKIQELVRRYSPIHEEILSQEVYSAMRSANRTKKELHEETLRVARLYFIETREDVGGFFWREGADTEFAEWRNDRPGGERVSHMAMPLLHGLAAHIVLEYGKKPVRQMAEALGRARLAKAESERLLAAWKARKENAE